MPDLSIVTANIDSPEWAKLLISSIRKFTTMDYEIVVIDNGSLFNNLIWLEAQEDVRLVKLRENMGHGGAMDLSVVHSRAPYICFTDVDSHFMRTGWEADLLDIYNSDPKIKLIGCVGPPHKPFHPPLFLYERDFIGGIGISFKHVPGVSTDTAQKSFWDIQKLGCKVHRLEKGEKQYGLMGDEIYINGKSTIYHHWYGTRFCENNPNRIKHELDGYKLEDHLAEKAKLYQQPLVQEILGITPHHASQVAKMRDYLKCRDMMMLNGGLPWIESGATEMLEGKLTDESRVLEIGSGSSTLWFAKRSEHTTSFESNFAWFNVVKDELDSAKLENVDLRYEPKYPQNGLTDLNGHYDAILIDGETQGREDFVRSAIGHIRKGGLIVLDDSQRVELYHKGMELLDSKGWERKDFNDGKGARITSVWRVS